MEQSGEQTDRNGQRKKEQLYGRSDAAGGSTDRDRISTQRTRLSTDCANRIGSHLNETTIADDNRRKYGLACPSLYLPVAAAMALGMRAVYTCTRSRTRLKKLHVTVDEILLRDLHRARQ